MRTGHPGSPQQSLALLPVLRHEMVRPSGPYPWKVLRYVTLPIKRKAAKAIQPLETYCAGNHCDPDWVWGGTDFCQMSVGRSFHWRFCRADVAPRFHEALVGLALKTRVTLTNQPLEDLGRENHSRGIADSGSKNRYD